MWHKNRHPEPEKRVQRPDIGGLFRKSPAIINIMKSLGDIDVSWQPRRVDRNAHV